MARGDTPCPCGYYDESPTPSVDTHHTPTTRLLRLKVALVPLMEKVDYKAKAPNALRYVTSEHERV